MNQREKRNSEAIKADIVITIDKTGKQNLRNPILEEGNEGEIKSHQKRCTCNF